MRIGFDVDGVLANYNMMFIGLLIDITGRDEFPPCPFDIPKWDYPSMYGYTEDEVSRAVRHIKDSPDFWFRLPGYADTLSVIGALNLLQHSHDTYFITARPGKTAKHQTERWLWRHGFDQPTVLISSQKGICARGLELDFYIDDRDRNVEEVRLWYPPTRVFLLDRPWNRVFDAEPHGISRVPSALDMLKVIPV